MTAEPVGRVSSHEGAEPRGAEPAVDGSAPGSWAAVAQDVADGVASPWSVASVLGAYDDASLLALPEVDAVAVVELCRRLAAAVEGVQLLAIEAVARRDEETVEALEARWLAERQAGGRRGGPSGLRGVVSASECTVATLLPVLRLSPRATASVLEDARMLVGSLPETFALVRGGRLSTHHARVVAGAAACVAVDKRDELDLVLVHPELGRRRYRRRLPDLATPSVRQRVAQVVSDVDPDSLRRHTQAAREGRHVRVRAGMEPGVSSWSASLTTEDSLAMWAAIDALADEFLRADETAEASLLQDAATGAEESSDSHGRADAGDHTDEGDHRAGGDGTAARRRGISAARADALVALVLGRATVTTTVDLTVPLTDWPMAPTAATAAETGTSSPDPSGMDPESVDPESVDPESVDPESVDPESVDPAPRFSSVELGLAAIADSARDPARDANRDAALEADLGHLLRGTDEDVVGGVHIVQVRPHLRLVLDRPTSLGTDPDRREHRPTRPPSRPSPAPSIPTPSSPSIPTPSSPSSRLSWLVGVDHPRVGVLLPDAVVRLLADPDTRIRLHGCHPDTGALTTHDPTTYRPGAALARAVRSRDGHCRFPGCTTEAARCQLDHVTPYPTGPTSAANLAALCAGHHRLKTHTPWRYVLHDDGTCTWTSPLGYRYDTHPDRPTDRAA